MNEEKLQSLFGTYGNVVSCKAPWSALPSEVSVEASALQLAAGAPRRGPTGQGCLGPLRHRRRSRLGRRERGAASLSAFSVPFSVWQGVCSCQVSGTRPPGLETPVSVTGLERDAFLQAGLVSEI